jgi:hypothetical protein
MPFHTGENAQGSRLRPRNFIVIFRAAKKCRNASGEVLSRPDAAGALMKAYAHRSARKPIV